MSGFLEMSEEIGHSNRSLKIPRPKKARLEIRAAIARDCDKGSSDAAPWGKQIWIPGRSFLSISILLPIRCLWLFGITGDKWRLRDNTFFDAQVR